MDIRCPKCGEPWDIDELHEVAEENGTSFDHERKQFFSRGCEIFGSQCNGDDADAAAASAALHDLLGDDVDGIAAMLEDEGF